jgi:hypothetical protein
MFGVTGDHGARVSRPLDSHVRYKAVVAANGSRKFHT